MIDRKSDLRFKWNPQIVSLFQAHVWYQLQNRDTHWGPSQKVLTALDGPRSLALRGVQDFIREVCGVSDFCFPLGFPFNRKM